MRKPITTVAWILTAVLLFALLNCSDDDNPVSGQPGPKVIWPLEVGNTWEYADTAGATGQQQQIFSSRIMVTARTVVSVDTVLYDAYAVVSTDSLTMEPTKQYMNNDELNGLWNYGVVCGVDSMMVRFLHAKYPVEVGDQFAKAFIMCAPGGSFGGFGTGTVTCVHTDTTYATPAGTFSCVLYHEIYNPPFFGESHVYTFIAPNVGMVAQEITSDLLSWKKILTSYTIK
jgi:hypothetical protein